MTALRDRAEFDALYDVVVVGSGAAGLTAALSASCRGASVLVLEKSAFLGGTSAISGGQIWAPGNALVRRAGETDDREDVVRYLRAVTLGQVDDIRLNAFAERAARLVDDLETQTDLRFFRVERPDYHPDFAGAGNGRSLEPEPFSASALGALAEKVRQSPVRPPLTSREGKRPDAAEIAASRRAENIRTQGAALVAGLVEGCQRRGVAFRLNARLVDLVAADGRIVGCSWTEEGRLLTTSARAGVVLASGGFEWNTDFKAAFLPVTPIVATTPPANEGDGLTIALRHGAGVANMSEGWWTAAVAVPGETWDARTLYRNIVRELALPGSILVNRAGRRFVNEAMSYNDLGKAFHAFDPQGWGYPNQSAWLIFDHRFKTRYPVVNVAPDVAAPDWFVGARDLSALAARTGVDLAGLEATLESFNAGAVIGKDPLFQRGQDVHGRSYGDSSHAPNPCLAPITQPPFYAIRILAGCNGTKGGVVTSLDGEALRFDGTTIAGLYACGNVAASSMGPGYPGTGGSLGPIMIEAFAAGEAAAANR